MESLQNQVKKALKEENYKTVFQIAGKRFTRLDKSARDIFIEAYECMVHPEFYTAVGINIEESIANAKILANKLFKD